jgi:hypothetical protein
VLLREALVLGGWLVLRGQRRWHPVHAPAAAAAAATATAVAAAAAHRQQAGSEHQLTSTRGA